MIRRFMDWIYWKYFRQLVSDQIDPPMRELMRDLQKKIDIIRNRTDVAVGADICVGREPGFLVIATRIGKESFVKIMDCRSVKSISEWRDILQSLRGQFEPRERIDCPRGMSDYL